MRVHKREGGMVIIEATIVFPVMFLVIFFMIFMGNAYYQKCKIEAIVTELTLDGAAYCASPLLRDVDKTGKAPTFGKSTDPWRYYRYFTKMGNTQQAIEQELETQVGGVGTGLFSCMKPNRPSAKVQPNNYVVYSTFSIDLDYMVPLPIKLLGEQYFSSFRVETHAESAVTDAPEFIRNVNMVEDYLKQTGVDEKIKEAIDKAKGFFKKK
ncbi:MAG: pilus assembly protein [Oscillospiraceae bacterium]|nr:pilus assembly protein [Oscillospiraceae bacterium]